MVHHVEVVLAIEGHATRAIELALTTARCAPLAEELAGGAELLDAVLALRTDVDAALAVHGNGRWPDELAVPRAVRAKVSPVFAVHRADGDVRVALCRRATVEHVDDPIGAEGAVNGQAKTPPALGQQANGMTVTEAKSRAHTVLL